MLPPESPCARADRLRAVRESLILGEAVTETRFGEDMVKFAKADAAGLDRLIAEADAACAVSRGEVPKPRRRYAMGARFRPY